MAAISLPVFRVRIRSHKLGAGLLFSELRTMIFFRLRPLTTRGDDATSDPPVTWRI